jgi:hypothetical protein
MGDDAQGSASALGAGSVQCRSLLLVEQLGEVGLHRMEMDSAQGQRATSVPVSKHAKVANLHKTGGQDVEQEAADELRGGRCSRLRSILACQNTTQVNRWNIALKQS